MGRIPCKMIYSRFIPGKPTPAILPIQLTGLNLNFFLTLFKCQYYSKVNYIKVWTYEKPPKALFIDCSTLLPNEKIRIREVNNYYLPDFCYPHVHMDNAQTNYVILIEDNENILWNSQNYFFSQKDIKLGENVKVETNSTEFVEEKQKVAPKMPFYKASGKVLTTTKDKGSSITAVKEFIENRRKNYRLDKYNAQFKKDEVEQDPDDLDF